MRLSDWLTIAGLTITLGLPVALWAKLRSLATMAEDWSGRPERRDPLTGVVIDPGRASLPGRIAALEAQIHPNHGTSMHDQVTNLASEVAQLRALVLERMEVHQ